MVTNSFIGVFGLDLFAVAAALVLAHAGGGAAAQVLERHIAAALGAGFLDGHVPGHEIAGGVVFAAVEFTAFFVDPLDQALATLGAGRFDVGEQGLGIAALRETGAGQELAETPAAVHQHGAAVGAWHIADFRSDLHFL